MRTQDEILDALRQVILNRQRAIVLLRHQGKATDAAEKFREYLREEGREKLLKPAGSNQDFVKLSNGAWVYFISCEELAPTDEVGQPDFVFWPTEGAEYAIVSHRDWKLLRSKEESCWRPLEALEEEPREPGETSVWDRLSAKDDF